MFRFILFLFSNNFLSLSCWISVLLLVIIFINNKKKTLVIPKSFTFIILIISTIVYCSLLFVNNIEFSISSFVLRIFLPIILFYIGFIRGLDGYNVAKKDIIISSAGLFLHGILNVFKNRNVDILTVDGRQYQDIYGGIVSATIQNLMFVLSSGLLFYFIFYEKNTKTKIFGIVAAILSLYGTIANASRTLIYVSFIVFFVCLIVHIFYNKNNSSKVNFLFVFSFFSIILIFSIWFNFFGIKEWYASTPLGIRSAITTSTIQDNLRWTYSKAILTMLPNHLFSSIPYSHYAHNFWLDIAREVGTFSFCFYVLFTILSIIELFKFIKIYHSNLEKVILYTSVFLSYFIVFFTEPVMQGSPLSFSIWCFIIGTIVSQNKKVLLDF